MASSVKLQGTGLYQDTTEVLDLKTNGSVKTHAAMASSGSITAGSLVSTGSLAAVTASFSGDLTVSGFTAMSGNVHIVGDLDVAGAINSVTKTTSILEVEDLNIICASGSNASAADEGGLLIGGHALADSVAGFTWDNDASSIQFSIAGTNEALMSATVFSPATDDGMALGCANLNWSDLYLADAARLYFGDDQDVSLVHIADTGLRLSSDDQLQFGDSGTYVHQSTDGQLDMIADVKAMVTAPVISAVVTLATTI